jgi:hypothetical protein
MPNPYPHNLLDEDDDEDGRMPANVDDLSSNVVGHRIVSAERITETDTGTRYNYSHTMSLFVITLDNGTLVRLRDTQDECAYTELETFLLHPERVNHVITGVATTDGFTRWHIYADAGDILELSVGWCCGDFGYGYGFDIKVANI